MRSVLTCSFAVLALAVPAVLTQPAVPSPQEASAQLKKISVNGDELAYVEEGAGEPVVLVHGSLVDYRYTLPLMRELARGHRVINYSRRCHAPNPCPPGAAYSHRLHAEDLAALIRELKIGPAHIVGHSYGGAVAVYMAQQHPELVRSLVLVEPGLYGIMPTHERALQVRQEMAAAVERARDALAHEMEEEAVRQLVDMILRPRRFTELSMEMRAALLENLPSWRAAAAAATPPPPFTCEHAEQLRLPALLLEGEKSAPEYGLVNSELARCLPEARRVKIPAADHNLVYEQPQAVAQAVSEFLAAGATAKSEGDVVRKVEFENDQVVVTRIVSPAGFVGQMHSHDAAGLEIFITDDHIRETLPDGSAREWRAKAGELACMEPVTHRVENLRSEPSELLSIEFKGERMKACPKQDAEAVRAGVEFENDRVRITRGKIGPRQTGQMHSHPEYIGIFLTDAKLRAHLSDGTVRELEGKRGMVRGAAPVTHRIENLADTPFEAIDINLKPAPGKSKP